MRKRSSKRPKQEETPTPADQPAPEPETVQPEETAQSEGKNPAAVALGRLGGKKGGPARAAKLTKEQRSEIAKKAARARWRKSTQAD